MVELRIGRYDHDFAHSMSGKWLPSRTRPFWASAVYQASVVGWRNQSATAIRKKAKHFRATVAKATAQLPTDQPGVVHVGVETWAGSLGRRSEEHTSELQSLMRISYAVFCLEKTKHTQLHHLMTETHTHTQ